MQIVIVSIDSSRLPIREDIVHFHLRYRWFVETACIATSITARNQLFDLGHEAVVEFKCWTAADGEARFKAGYFLSEGECRRKVLLLIFVCLIQPRDCLILEILELFDDVMMFSSHHSGRAFKLFLDEFGSVLKDLGFKVSDSVQTAKLDPLEFLINFAPHLLLNVFP